MQVKSAARKAWIPWVKAQALWTRLVLERRFDAPPEFTRRMGAEQLGISSLYPDLRRGAYFPSPYGILKRILRSDEVCREDVFIDLGCGTGRVLVEAADSYPFGRVIGVDFVPRLTAIARETVDRNRERLLCRDVEVVTADVLDYQVPDDVTFVYIYNSFRGDIFEAVITRLTESVDRNPRRVRIIYSAPSERRLLERTGRVRLIRYGRRMLRRWSQLHSLAMYEVLPSVTRQERS